MKRSIVKANFAKMLALLLAAILLLSTPMAVYAAEKEEKPGEAPQKTNRPKTNRCSMDIDKIGFILYHIGARCCNAKI